MKRTLILIFISLSYYVQAQQTIMVDPQNLVADQPDHINVTTLQQAYDAIVVNSSNVIAQDYVIYLHGDVKIGGDLTLDVPLSWAKSGTAQDAIIIKSYDPANQATLSRNFEDSYKNSAFIQFPEASDVNYLEIDNIIFQDAAKGIDLDANYSKITNCKFYINDFIVAGGGAAIDITGGSHHNLISGNLVEFNSEAPFDRCWKDADILGYWKCYDLYHGIYLANGHDNEITFNTVINAPGAGIHSWHGPIESNLIQYNMIYKCGGQNFKVKDTWMNDEVREDVEVTRLGLILSEDNLPVQYNHVLFNHIYRTSPRTIGRSGYDFVKNIDPPSGVPPLACDTSFDLPNPVTNYTGINDMIVLASRTASNEFKGNTFCEWSGSDCVSNTATQYASRYNMNYNDSGEGVEIHEFIPGEILVVLKDKGTILKIDGTNTSASHNMFALKIQNNVYSSVSGYEYLIGSQIFPNKKIVDVEWANGYLFVALDDRRMAKINGTGGTGENMFGITETSYGFANVPTYNYLAGSHRFSESLNHFIVDIMYASGFTFVSFSDGSLLKVNGTGGGGADMFAIVESNGGTYTFSRRAAYSHYCGDAKFSSPIIKMKYIDGVSFFCFANNKVLKINGVGGSNVYTGNNHNMFQVNEVLNNPDVGFTKITGTNHYNGDAIFNSKVSDIIYAAGYSFFSFVNGKMLKINGVGGSGNNMFAVTDEATRENGFSPVGSYAYYAGDAVFKEYTMDGSVFQNYVTKTVYQGTNLLIGFSSGKMIKIQNLSKTGHNMFEVSELYHDFDYQVPLLYCAGDQIFHSAITDLKYINGHTFVCLLNGKILRVAGTGSTGAEMFYISENSNDFSQLRKNGIWAGDQNLMLASYDPGGRARTTAEINPGNPEPEFSEKESLRIFPNPSQTGKFRVINNEDSFTIEVFDFTGSAVTSRENHSREAELDLSTYTRGFYIVKVSDAKGSEYKRLIYH